MKWGTGFEAPGIGMDRGRSRKSLVLLLALLAALWPAPAEASIFQGETLDKLAGCLAWVVLIVVPIVGIAVFWLVHILPEKIAEKKKHPQAKAIHVLCLLSLAFGGLLWPLAWLWAYTKPVLYKMAYGKDVGDEPGHGEGAKASEADTETEELKRLRARIAELETKGAARPAESRV